MVAKPIISVYGAKRCHKTLLYLNYLKSKNIEVVFFDVEKDEAAAKELRKLYATGKLNFPTLVIGNKKMRNPSLKDLGKKLIANGFVESKNEQPQ